MDDFTKEKINEVLNLIKEVGDRDQKIVDAFAERLKQPCVVIVEKG